MRPVYQAPHTSISAAELDTTARNVVEMAACGHEVAFANAKKPRDIPVHPYLEAKKFLQESVSVGVACPHAATHVGAALYAEHFPPPRSQPQMQAGSSFDEQVRRNVNKWRGIVNRPSMAPA